MSENVVELRKPASKTVLTTSSSRTKRPARHKKKPEVTISPPEPRKPDSYWRSRTLKRGCAYRPVQDDDMKWLWAAYRRGVFAHLPEFPDGMDTFDFQTTILGVLSENIFGRKGEAWLFIAQTPRGEIPVGMVIAVPNRGHIEPHVFWFPEASARNKLECAIKWLHEMKKTWKIDLWIRASDWQFYDHLCKYGLLRTVGKYRKHFEDGEDAFIFQSVS